MLLLLSAAVGLDVRPFVLGVTPGACMGKRALLVTSHEAASSLEVADALLREGASVEVGCCVSIPRPLGCAARTSHLSSDGSSVTGRDPRSQLMVPLPRSGSASESEGALKLLQRIQRRGFHELMEQLDYVSCDPRRSYRTGNRPRVSWSHVRADDVEALALALLDSDMLVLDGSISPLADDAEERARFRMRRTILEYLLSALRRQGAQLERCTSAPFVRWAWLPHAATE